LIERLRQEGLMGTRQVLGGYALLAGDGTRHFCSGSRCCPHCLTKERRNGSTTCHHQILGAVWAQPGEKNVFPVAVEPIVRQDGKQKFVLKDLPDTVPPAMLLELTRFAIEQWEAATPSPTVAAV